jgi:hypothetical protein
VTQRFARLALVTVLVASVFAVGATGTVAAQDSYEKWDSETCKEQLGAGWTLTCILAPGLAEPPQKVDHSDAFGARGELITQNATISSDAAAFNRTANRLEGALWSIGFAEYRDELANGSSNSVAMSEAQKAIQKHGTAELQAMVNKNNVWVQNMYSAFQAAEDASNWDIRGQPDSPTTFYAPGVSNETLTVHGQDFNVSYIGDSSSKSYYPLKGYMQDAPMFFQDQSGDSTYGGNYVYSADAVADYNTAYEGIKNAISNAQSEVQTFDTNFDGSASDLENITVDPRTYADQFSDTNSSGLAAGTLAISGYDIDAQEELTVSHNGGDNITGLFGMSSDLAAETGTINEGDTLDLDSKSGEAILIETDGSGEQHSWTSGTLEIVDTGDRSNITYKERTLDTANISQTLDQLREIDQLQANATEWQSGGGSGGGLGSGLVGGGLGLVALLGAAFLLMRDGDDGSGGGRGRN